MTIESGLQGGDLFIVDNSERDWKVRRYLHDWTEIAQSFDIATGYFEIGALLLLDQQWQKLARIGILMGDDVSKRTKKAPLSGVQEIKKKLDSSIEAEKEKNNFLGIPIDRKTLTDELKRIGRIRNDVMHFDPDGVAPEDLAILRKFARFLGDLEKKLN